VSRCWEVRKVSLPDRGIAASESAGEARDLLSMSPPKTLAVQPDSMTEKRRHEWLQSLVG
jgi:hypothetical protein